MKSKEAPEVIAEKVEVLFLDVLRKGRIIHIQDVCEMIRPEVEQEMRRATRDKRWKMRSDFLYNTLRLMANKENGLALAFCGDAVWLMDAVPYVTKRFYRPTARKRRR